MRPYQPAVAISLAIHAAVVGWLTARAPSTALGAQAAPPTSTPIELVTVDRAPDPELSLALLPEPPEPPDTRVRPPATPDVPHPDVQHPAISTVRPPASSGVRPPAAPDTGVRSPASDGRPPDTGVQPPGTPDTGRPPGRPGLLTMRRGGAPSAALPVGRWDNLDHVPRGTDAVVDRPSGELQPDGNGGFRSDQSGFDARIERDGTASLTDRSAFDPHLALPRPKAVGRSIARWYESEKGTFGEGGDTSAGKQIQVSSGSPAAATDPVTGANPDHAMTVIIPIIGGGFEVTDWLMRRLGEDPYSSRKLKFLDTTRDERVRMGEHHRRDQLAATPQIVQRNLEALWAAIPDPALRKRALFEVWDECDEAGDAETRAAAAAARRMVIGFIRSRLPAGSAAAYTAAELAELARKQRSKAAFAPYE